MEERELIVGCLREDAVCQRILFEKYAGKMLTVCRRYARHHLEAEDMMQDGFIKCFDKLSQFHFKGSFEGWLRRIMINTALKHYRKSSFQKEQIGLEDYESGSVEPTAISALSEEEILQEIAALPTGYRIVFNLYVMEGYSHQEIGQAIGIGESTSRSQLVKARRMLQAKLMQHLKLRV